MDSGAEDRNVQEESVTKIAEYEKREGFASAKGEEYEVALCCLLFLRALRHSSDFFLASNHKLAGIFDDVVLFYRLKGDQSHGYRAILLQAKHKDNFTEKKLTLSNPFKLRDYLKSFSDIRQQWKLLTIVGNRKIQLHEIKLLLYTTTGCKVDDCAEDVTDLPQVKHIKLFVNTGGRLLRVLGAERIGLPQGEETSHFLGHLLLCTQQMSVEKADQYLEDELCNVLRVTSSAVIRKLKTALKREVKAWWSEKGAVRYLTAESQEWKKVLEIQVRCFNKDTLNIDTRLNLHFIEGLTVDHRSWICVRDEFQANSVRSRIFRAQRNSLVVGAKLLDDHLKEVEALWNSNICPTLVVDISAVSPVEGFLMLQRLQEAARKDSDRHLTVIARGKPASGDWSEVAAEPTWSILHQDTRDRLLAAPLRLQGKAVTLRDVVGSYVCDVMTDEVISFLCQCESEMKLGAEMPAPLEYYVPRCLERSPPNTITIDSLITTNTLLFPHTNISSSNKLSKSFKTLYPFEMDTIKEIKYPIIVKGVSDDYDIRQLCFRFSVKGISGEFSMEGIHGNEKEFIPFIWNYEEKIVVIEGPPGVGKSSFVTMMCSRVKEQFPEAWVLRLDMGRHTAYIKDTDFTEFSDIKDFLLKSLPEDANNLDRQILEHSLSVTGNVFFFLDAFDEISPDFTTKCIDFLKGIDQTIRYRQMVVTTRPVTTRDVEEALETKAFTLPVFSKEEQNLFFKHFSEVKGNKVSEEEISSLHQSAGTILEIPLLCRMASDVLLHRRKQRLHRFVNPWRKVLLYELFVEQSVKDRIADKLELDPFNPIAKKLLESDKNSHLQNLQGLAVRKLIPLDHLSHLSVSTVTPEEKLGLVVNIGGRVDFEHHTFAEYFLGYWLACNWQKFHRKFLRGVLLRDGFQFVAATFSWSLFNGFPVHVAVARGDVDAVRALVFRCAATMDRGGRSALHVAAMTQGDHHEMWELLMTSRDDLTGTDNVLGTTAIKYAEFSANWEFVNVLLKKRGDKQYSVVRNAATKVLTYLRVKKRAIIDDLKLSTDEQAAKEVIIYVVKKDLATLFQFILRRHTNIFKNESPLHIAAANNSIAVIKVLIEMLHKIEVKNEKRFKLLHESSRNADVETETLVLDLNRKTEDGETALTVAAREGHLEAVKLLLEYGADSNIQAKYGDAALTEAARRGHLEVVTLLLDKGADINIKTVDGETPLTKASSQGHLEVMKVLLDNGADINIKTTDGHSALSKAASRGHLEVVKILLECGTELNMMVKGSHTVLMRAARRGHLEVVKVLLGNGASLNFKSKYNGYTALTWAAVRGRLEVVKLLLDNGADISIKNLNGETALMKAAFRGYVEIVMILLDKGGDPDTINIKGESALILASREGHLEVVKRLVEYGADLNVKTFRGKSALMLAKQRRHLDVVTFLTDHQINNL